MKFEFTGSDYFIVFIGSYDNFQIKGFSIGTEFEYFCCNYEYVGMIRSLALFKRKLNEN